MQEKEPYQHGQPPLDLEGAKLVEKAPAAPNLLFTTRILYEDRSNETIEHNAAPKFVDDFIQLARTEDLVMVNKRFIRKAVTSVKVLKEENGHKRIIT